MMRARRFRCGEMRGIFLLAKTSFGGESWDLNSIDWCRLNSYVEARAKQLIWCKKEKKKNICEVATLIFFRNLLWTAGDLSLKIIFLRKAHAIRGINKANRHH